MKRVRDEQGNYYMVDDNGQLINSSPNGGFSLEEISGVQEQPNLASLAKEQGAAIAEQQLQSQVSDLVTGAGGTDVTGSVLGNSGSLGALYNSQGVAANATANAGFNSAAMGGEVLPEVATAGSGSATSLAGIGSAGNVILPAAGAVGAYDLYNNQKKLGTGSGYMQGAASGAAMGSYFGPWGAAIGGVIGLGANAFLGESRTKVEQERRKQLAKAGIIVPNQDVKEWENNAAFKASRNEADLTGKDIINAAQFYGIKGYAEADAVKKEAIANEAVKRGLIREHHGTIDVNLDTEYKKYLDSQLSGAPVASSDNGSPGRRPQGPSREVVAQAKKDKKKSILAQIMPELDAPVTRAPDYGKIDVANLIKNPYL